MQVQSILKEVKGGKLVKTPTQPCRKQRNLFCNVPMLSGSYAHHGTMSAGAQCGASSRARPYGPGWATCPTLGSCRQHRWLGPRTWLGFHRSGCSWWCWTPLPLAAVPCSSGRKSSLFRDALSVSVTAC